MHVMRVAVQRVSMHHREMDSSFRENAYSATDEATRKFFRLKKWSLKNFLALVKFLEIWQKFFKTLPVEVERFRQFVLHSALD